MFTDDFIRADSADIGNGWTELDPSVFSIVGNKLRGVGAGQGYDQYAYAPASADFLEGTAACTFIASVDGAYPQLITNLTIGGSQSFYSMYVDESTNLFGLGVVNGTVYTEFVSSSAGTTINSGTKYRIEFDRAGNDLTARLYNATTETLIRTLNHTHATPLTGTKQGVTVSNTAAGNVEFELFNSTPIVDAPTISGNPTIDTAGTSLSITFSEAVSVGAGGSAGFVLSTGQSLTYSSGAGTSTLIYTVSPAIKQGLATTLAYTQPTDGIEATDDQTDVAAFSGQVINNNSTAVPTITIDLGIGTGGAVTSLTNLRLDVLSGGAAPRTLLYSVDNETSDGSTDVVVTDDALGNIGDTVYVAIVDVDSTPDRTVFLPVTVS